MKYLSVCSGIEAATVAWHPLGWSPIAFAEVEAFPSAVLKHHYPGVPNWGDLTKFKEWPDAAVDVLVGGTPCQSFSVAGLRAGLGDPRGNLALTFLAVVDRYRPRWVVWENVPGVLSSDSHDAPDPPPPAIDLDGGDGPADGAEIVVEDEYDADEVHAFACLLAGFSELGYHGAYGTLDAQYFRLAQRRRRVFAVFHSRNWRRAAAVLLERASLSGHPAPRRETGAGTPVGALGGTSPGGGWRFGPDEAAAGQLVAFGGNNTAGPINVATAVRAKGGTGHGDFESETFIAGTLSADYGKQGGNGMGEMANGLIAFDTTQITHPENRSNPKPGDPAPSLSKGAHPPAIAFDTYNQSVTEDATQTLCSRGDSPGGNSHLVPAVAIPLDIRNATREDCGTGAGTPATGIGEDGDAAPTVTSVASAVAFNWQSAGDGRGLRAQAQALSTRQTPAVAFQESQSGFRSADTHPTLDPNNGSRRHHGALLGMQVRRLTPRECERLQGFPDDYTLIPYRGKPAADGPRYKALGNSMAVPVMAWIGRRIALVDAIDAERTA